MENGRKITACVRPGNNKISLLTIESLFVNAGALQILVITSCNISMMSEQIMHKCLGHNAQQHEHQ